MNDLIALLNMINAYRPGHACIQFHDYSGETIASATQWAVAHNVKHSYGHKEGYSAANLEIEFERGVVVVIHDMRTYEAPARVENVGGEWSPAQQAVAP